MGASGGQGIGLETIISETRNEHILAILHVMNFCNVKDRQRNQSR